MLWYNNWRIFGCFHHPYMYSHPCIYVYLALLEEIDVLLQKKTKTARLARTTDGNKCENIRKIFKRFFLSVRKQKQHSVFISYAPCIKDMDKIQNLYFVRCGVTFISTSSSVHLPPFCTWRRQLEVQKGGKCPGNEIAFIWDTLVESTKHLNFFSGHPVL